MPTKVPLQSVVLTAATSSVTFSGIDQTYQDLELVISGSANPAQNVNLRYNGDTASNYSGNYAIGDGSTTGAGRFSSQTAGALTGAMYAGLGMCTILIPNYSNTTTYKTAIGRSSTAATLAAIYSSLWRSTAAITSITLNCTLDSGTTIDLYGVSPVNAKVTSASGGTAIYYDSTYAYHVFTGTGAFVPNRALTADVLVVAGGGGGGAGTNGSNGGGGGGAGGLLAFTSQSLTASTSYAVTVGAGGVGNGGTGVSTNGADSQFGALTLVKGGGAGGSNYGSSASWPGSNGGSGGGGYGRSAAGGSPTSGQGNTGGTGGADSGNYSGAGGGGAGGVGANGNSAGTAGAGGIGLSTYSSWASATGTGASGYYAGGGAGGSYSSTAATGGSGGGGNGGASTAVATSGVTNTGGGGGASGGNSTGAGVGANGASGIVIVRYVR